MVSPRFHRTLLAAAAVLVLAAAGCGVKDPSRITIELGEASVAIEQADGVHHRITLAKDGTVAFDDNPLAKISRDGRLSRDGRTVLTLVKGGHVLVYGRPSNVVIGDDASFTLDEQPQLSFGDDGTLTGALLTDLDHPLFEGDGAHLRYQGPERVRRAMMLGVVGLVTYGPGVPLAR